MRKDSLGFVGEPLFNDTPLMPAIRLGLNSEIKRRYAALRPGVKVPSRLKLLREFDDFQIPRLRLVRLVGTTLTNIRDGEALEAEVRFRLHGQHQFLKLYPDTKLPVPPQGKIEEDDLVITARFAASDRRFLGVYMESELDRIREIVDRQMVIVDALNDNIRAEIKTMIDKRWNPYVGLITT